MSAPHIYEEAVRYEVCSRCIDFGADEACQDTSSAGASAWLYRGGRPRWCHSRDPEGCAVYRFLPQLIELAEKIHDGRIEPYAEAVREQLCPYCPNQHPDGSCDIRDSLFCGLDRYLPLVLEALENVRMQESGKGN